MEGEVEPERWSALRPAGPACRSDRASQRIYSWIRGQDPDEASLSPATGLRPPVRRAVLFRCLLCPPAGRG